MPSEEPVVVPTVASIARRLAANVAGDFYVDASCIDCDACRQFAPDTFRDSGGQSAVYHQPESPDELLRAQKALISCPTSSIGSTLRRDVRPALADLPELVEGAVYRCGYTSESSFGAFSYVIHSPRGNILIDSPRFAGPLVANISSMGGLRLMLLTHADDVADHEKFHRRFGCPRVLHKADVRHKTGAIEIQPEGENPVAIDPDVLMIPTPGHTRGHAVYLYRNRILFSGDHLAWDVDRQRLYAFRGACWYSWSEQIRSMKRLLNYRFEWVLPGHGRPIHLPADQMHEELGRCVDWMDTAA
jgi:glyoxylase-like metal-dependent hydrolase (beta-lactamase superfamily II)/ferredoxin